MADDEVLDELLTFFKALIDPDRLVIAGRLAESEETIESLADHSGLSRVDVQRHLDRLAEAGLVTATVNVYSLDRDALHARARRVLSAKVPVTPPTDYPEKVLADYLQPDGSLKEIPSQLKKKLIVYEHITSQFETGRQYAEKEVNELLKRFHADFVSIRRDLFDLGFIARQADGSAYWRSETNTF